MLSTVKQRFFLYWVVLWVILSSLVSLLVNPLSSNAGNPFWNPTVWGLTMTISYVITWFVDRYQTSLGTFFDDGIVKRLGAIGFWGMLTWFNGDAAAKSHDTLRKCVASVFGIVVLCVLLNLLGEIKNRLRTWQACRTR